MLSVPTDENKKGVIYFYNAKCVVSGKFTQLVTIQLTISKFNQLQLSKFTTFVIT
ncbi:hypothetical protein GLIP_1994 [Aliiglaciecola lipolytica E3]|uniref:Uncharacterized protein n=1 Tax=Aliiglaciecola lipolytica E3 TaxID=1127673 RepID=K6Y8T6_9ALTE|nr:hypothetical protein GLIP_1994 [Aliiglaciecola lipolytica E3]